MRYQIQRGFDDEPTLVVNANGDTLITIKTGNWRKDVRLAEQALVHLEELDNEYGANSTGFED
jgi:hypothetical protein